MPTTDAIDPTPAAETETTELERLEGEHRRWTQSRIRIDELLGAITAELEQTTEDLAAARRAAILSESDDDTKTIGQLVGRQRKLEAERDELLERLQVATDEERNAQQASALAKLTRVAADFERRAGEFRAAAVESDAELDERIRALRDALDERAELDRAAQELVAHADEARSQYLRAGLEFPLGRLDIAGVRFDPARIPALTAARPGYPLTV